MVNMLTIHVNYMAIIRGPCAYARLGPDEDAVSKEVFWGHSGWRWITCSSIRLASRRPHIPHDLVSELFLNLLPQFHLCKAFQIL